MWWWEGGSLQKQPCFPQFLSFLWSVIFLIQCTHSNQTITNRTHTNLNHWTLCFFFFPPPHWHLHLLLYHCACAFSRSFQSHSFSLSQSWFPLLLQYVPLLAFMFPFTEHPHLCRVPQWVTQIKATFLDHWAYEWMSVSSGDLTSSRSFKYIDSFPMGSSTSHLMVSSHSWTENGTVGSLSLVSSILFYLSQVYHSVN